MFTVKIGELRNRLSHYLKKVRQGMEVTITDRDTAIGRIIPFQAGREEPFEITSPPKGYEGLARLSFPRPRRKIKIDAVAELIADRRRR